MGSAWTERTSTFLLIGGRIFMEWWPVPRALSVLNYLNEPRQIMVMLEKEQENFPLPSQLHSEEQLDGLYKFSSERGTTCCATLEREYYQHLLLMNNNTFEGHSLEIGLSHVKSYKRLPGVDRFSYLTCLYAVRSDDPYQVVTMSGFFCLNWEEK